MKTGSGGNNHWKLRVTFFVMLAQPCSHFWRLRSPVRLEIQPGYQELVRTNAEQAPGNFRIDFRNQRFDHKSPPGRSDHPVAGGLQAVDIRRPVDGRLDVRAGQAGRQRGDRLPAVGYRALGPGP